MSNKPVEVPVSEAEAQVHFATVTAPLAGWGLRLDVHGGVGQVHLLDPALRKSAGVPAILLTEVTLASWPKFRASVARALNEARRAFLFGNPERTALKVGDDVRLDNILMDVVEVAPGGHHHLAVVTPHMAEPPRQRFDLRIPADLGDREIDRQIHAFQQAHPRARYEIEYVDRDEWEGDDVLEVEERAPDDDGPEDVNDFVPAPQAGEQYTVFIESLDIRRHGVWRREF